MQQGNATRTSQASVSAALAAASGAVQASLASAVRFPGEDGGRSLAEMAQRDLDAALQLLADRAQYITGAGGAAIALRRSGKNDLLCRASTGSNAPELGALLSTEFGLSGESVRTRQPLRCDDAERDRRVNREVCRQMGIASVVVMPVVQDDQVLGVFELFSGKVNAFGERDLSALERLSGMVETAVRLAQAAEGLSEQLKTAEPAAEAVATEVVDVSGPEMEAAIEVATETVADSPKAVTAPATATPPPPAVVSEPPAAAKPAAPQRPLFWSVALHEEGEAPKPAEPDQSHVPPVLRNLRKCEACGFPISAGRTLCVECEEKRWRGQLRVPQAGAKQDSGRTTVPASRAFAAAAPSAATSAAIATPRPRANAETAGTGTAGAVSQRVQVQDSKKVAEDRPAADLPRAAVSNSRASDTAAKEQEAISQAPPMEVVFSAGLGSSQSWFAANKYVLGVLLVIAGAVAALLLLR